MFFLLINKVCLELFYLFINKVYLELIYYWVNKVCLELLYLLAYVVSLEMVFLLIKKRFLRNRYTWKIKWSFLRKELTTQFLSQFHRINCASDPICSWHDYASRNSKLEIAMSKISLKFSRITIKLNCDLGCVRVFNLFMVKT